MEERCWEGGALGEDGSRKEPVARIDDWRSICSWEQVGDKTSHPVEQPAHKDQRPQLQLCLYQRVTLNHCTMGLSPLDNCIREICSFAPIFQGNNCLRAKYLENNFHF